MSSPALANVALPAVPSPTSTITSSSTITTSAPTVKPCCVCKDEKAARDECMLFSKSSDPAQECSTMVEKYRNCMRDFGFTV